MHQFVVCVRVSRTFLLLLSQLFESPEQSSLLLSQLVRVQQHVLTHPHSAAAVMVSGAMTSLACITAHPLPPTPLLSASIFGEHSKQRRVIHVIIAKVLNFSLRCMNRYVHRYCFFARPSSSLP